MAGKKKVIIILLSAFFLLLAIFLLTYFFWSQNYKNRLLPKTFIGEFDVSQMTRNEVEKILKGEEEKIRKSGIEFSYGDKIAFFPLSLKAASPDIPELSLRYADSFSFEHEETLNKLFTQENKSFIKYLKTQTLSDNKNKFYFSFSYSPQILREWITEVFPSANIEPENAYFSLEETNGEEKLTSVPEKIGKEIDWENAERYLVSQLSELKNSEIRLRTRSKYPEINQSELEKLKPEAEQLLAHNDFNLYFLEQINEKDKKVLFSIDRKEIITWVSAKKNNINSLSLEFDLKKIKTYLEKDISPQINQDVILPRFEIKDGKVSNWQAGKNGREINLEKSAQNIYKSLLAGSWEAEIEIKKINVDDFDNNSFKIKEIIGIGHSNFAGSPANRRYNIKIGAEAVHGILIKPDEEFSLVKTLGEIDAASGYLPELVIKGDKTIPEYGGGLCQIATTIFRSALNSGLPITARRHHSYRVSYYEPAGMDAAVYDPWPDVKFVNDTNNYILVQSRLEGNDLYFDFWGTKDGRTASTTDPIIYNIVKPPPTKLVESEDLEPGEKKCTESAHNGADAYFDYIVIYPKGATSTPKQEVRFHSHYVPWQEVCLIGKEETEEESRKDEEEEILEDESDVEKM
jgi:vancomycin resistance protein YoaR